MSDDEQRTEDLIANGRLTRPARPARPDAVIGRRPLPPRSDVPPLSDTPVDMRDAEDR